MYHTLVQSDSKRSLCIGDSNMHWPLSFSIGIVMVICLFGGAVFRFVVKDKNKTDFHFIERRCSIKNSTVHHTNYPSLSNVTLKPLNRGF